MRIPSGKTDQLIYFVARSSTDGSRLTGLSSFTVYRSRNGGAATAYTTPTVAELSAANMPGVYVLTIDEDTTIASGSDSEEYTVHITATGMLPVTRAIELYRRGITSGATSTAQTGDSYARLGAPAGASVSADIAAVKGDTAAIKAKTDNLPAAPAALGDIPTANQNADALLDRADALGTGFTLRKVLKGIGAVLMGKLSGAGTGTETVRDMADTKDMLVFTDDDDGNRMSVTRDLT